jgi:hypothetical protein
VFTARYALSPYIKQIRFVFKGLMGEVGVEMFKISHNGGETGFGPDIQKSMLGGVVEVRPI